MTAIQLPQPFPVIVEDKGEGWAHFLMEYGLEGPICWGVILDNGQFWQCPNEKVRFTKNWTMGRIKPDVFTKKKTTNG